MASISLDPVDYSQNNTSSEVSLSTDFITLNVPYSWFMSNDEINSSEISEVLGNNLSKYAGKVIIGNASYNTERYGFFIQTAYRVTDVEELRLEVLSYETYVSIHITNDNGTISVNKTVSS